MMDGRSRLVDRSVSRRRAVGYVLKSRFGGVRKGWKMAKDSKKRLRCPVSRGQVGGRRC